MLTLLLALTCPGLAQEPRAIDLLIDRIHTLEAEQAEIEADPLRVDALSESTALGEEISALRNRLAVLSTGVDPLQDQGVGSGPLSLDEELQSLLSPILAELRTVTERPRRIEALKTQVADYDRLLAEADGALSQLDATIEETTEADTLTELLALKAAWTERRTTQDELRTIAALELDELSQTARSVGELTRDVVQLFIHLRGRNLLIALSTFVFVFAGVRLLNRSLLRAAARRNIDTSSSIRLIQLLFYVLGSLGAVVSVLVVLYVLGDWFLLSIGVIALIGIGWGLREAVPRAIEELKLMLNLGSVREGERLVWAGVPWKVERINLRAVLVNPAFEEPMQIQLRHLIDLVSRPVGDTEPWFPTRLGDHVRFLDGRVGQVTGQGPELVTVHTEVGPRTLSTAAFLDEPLINLSRGFGVEALLPLHPRHRDDITRDIPAILDAHLRQTLSEEPVTEISVRFHRAERDALVVRALVHFQGSAAADYYRLSDTIQAALIQCCQGSGWAIALPQFEVTTHSRGR
ncbi:MAG: hypothetical protein ACI8RZ_001670 [Myxococcota bacterium]